MTDDRLAAAIAAHHEEHPPAPHVRAVGLVGELAVAEALDGALRRVILVTEVDESTCTLRIILASNRTETATDLDVIIDRATSGAPFDLVAQGELYGPVFPEQLDDALGSVSTELAGAIEEALSTDGESLQGLIVGIPLAGPEDPRRAFKETELEDLMSLVGPCRRWLSGGPSELTTLDPEVLLPPPAGTPVEEGFDHLDELVELLDLYEREGYRLSVDLRHWLLDVAADDLRRWQTEYGVDIWSRLLLLPLEDRVETLEAAESSDLRATYLRAQATAGTVTVDFITSRSREWSDAIVRTSEAQPNKSCRGRAVVAGASQ